MKKIAAWTLSLCLIFTMFGMQGAATGTPAVALSEASGTLGDTVELLISIKDFASVTDPGGNGIIDDRLSALQLSIAFDSSVFELVPYGISVEEPQISNPVLLSGSWSTDVLEKQDQAGKDYIYFSTFAATGLGAKLDGVSNIAKITLKVKKDAPVGVYTFPITIDSVVTGIEGTPKNVSSQFTAADGKATITARKPAVTLSDVSGMKGQTVNMELGIKNFSAVTDPGGGGSIDNRLGAVQGNIYYDAAVFAPLEYGIGSPAADKLPNPVVLPGTWATDMVIKTDDGGQSYLYFNTFAASGDGAVIDSGIIAKIPLKIKTDAPEGAYPFTIEIYSVSTGIKGQPKEVGDQFEAVGGTITVKKGIAGDLSQDGKTTAADVIALRAAILSGDPSPEQMAAGDLNGDGILDDTDAALLLENAGIIAGNVNGDNAVNAVDLMNIRKIMLTGNATEDQMAAGDLNGDGKFTALDLMRLRKLMMEKLD